MPQAIQSLTLNEARQIIAAGEHKADTWREMFKAWKREGMCLLL